MSEIFINKSAFKKFCDKLKQALSKKQDVLKSGTNIKKIRTDVTFSLTTYPEEDLLGDGTFNLHKVSKTGDYRDLNNVPIISLGEFTSLNDGNLQIYKPGIYSFTWVAGYGNHSCLMQIAQILSGYQQTIFVVNRGTYAESSYISDSLETYHRTFANGHWNDWKYKCYVDKEYVDFKLSELDSRISTLENKG